MMLQPTSCSLARFFPVGISLHFVRVRSRGPITWSRLCHLASAVFDVDIIFLAPWEVQSHPCVDTEFHVVHWWALWATVRSRRRPPSHNPGLMLQSHLLTHAVISCTAHSGSLCSSPQKRHADHLEARDHVPHTSENCYTYTDSNDFAILLNKDTFVPGSTVFSVSEASTSKDTWRHAALVTRGLLRRPSVVDSTHGPRSVQSTSAKKRDTPTSFLLRLREHMINHSVDFIG